MKNILSKLLVAVSLLSLAGSASAALITGSIGFTGNFTLDNTNFNTSTTVQITAANVQGTPTGSFLADGIADGDPVTHADIVYSPTGAVNNLWAVGTFTFDLASMTEDFKTNTQLNLSGHGTISSTDAGLDDTFGTWIFTANNLGGGTLTWSSGSAVPEPAIALLIAVGLLGFGVSRKMVS